MEALDICVKPPYTGGMVRWRVGEFLEQHGITPYRLSEKTQGKISRNAIYEISRADTKQVKFDTLDTLIKTLREMTGVPVGLADLLEFTDE